MSSITFTSFLISISLQGAKSGLAALPVDSRMRSDCGPSGTRSSSNCSPDDIDTPVWPRTGHRNQADVVSPADNDHIKGKAR